MLSFSPVVGIGTPPPPHTQASVYPHPFFPWGGGSLAGEGVGGPSSLVKIFTDQSVAGVSDRPCSQLSPLSEVAAQARQSTVQYIVWNRVHPMKPGGPVWLLWLVL